MKTISEILLGIMLLNGAIFSTFLSYHFWEEFCERREKKQQAAKTQPGGMAK